MIDRAMVLLAGPGVVVHAFQEGGDVLNAWDVLRGATGSDSATERAVRAACAREGVDFGLIEERLVAERAGRGEA